jgi:hypothetical protein
MTSLQFSSHSLRLSVLLYIVDMESREYIDLLDIRLLLRFRTLWYLELKIYRKDFCLVWCPGVSCGVRDKIKE